MSKTGWLTKEGGRYKTWKKRFMAIEGTELCYYKKEKKDQCGSIPLTGAEVAPVEYRNKKHCFKIVTPSRTFYICATSETEMTTWVKSLATLIASIPAPGGASGAAPVSSLKPAQTSDESVEEKPKPAEGKVGLDDFDLLKVIGKGSFGKVMLVRKKDNQKVYAMKILNKKTIMERHEAEHTKSEKSILMKLEFPFLVGLHFSFQTPDKLYFIMDYINGGELFYHLQKEKKFAENRVRFYGAEIAAALEYLHNAGVVYRDLKPENLLITSEGHIVMTDFGLSKEGLTAKEDRTGTFCGTPEYLAPEVLEGKGYGKAVDWWSFGTLMFEMMTGLPPFYDEDVQEMYTKILSADLEIPDYISEEASDLLHKLLDRDPETRLQDPAEIKAHPFFAPIDFDLLLEKQVTPPFIPSVRGEDDTANIDATFLAEPVSIYDEDESSGGNPDEADFEGFTYKGKGK